MLDPDGGAPGAATPAAPTPAVDGPIVDWDTPEEDEQEVPPAQPPAAPAAATPPAPAVPAAAQPATPPVAQPAAPAPPPAGPGAVAATPAAPTPPASAGATPTAWEFQADGRTVVVDGSTRHDDGSLTVPAAAIPHLETLLAEGAAHRGSWREEQQGYEGRIAELERAVADKANDPDLVRAKAYNQQLLALLAKGPEAVAAWLDDYERNFPVFQAKAEEAILRQQLTERETRLTALEEDRLAEQLGPQIQQQVANVVERLKAQHPNVNADQLHQRILRRHLDQVAYDVPATERPRGLEPGEVLLGRGPKGELWIVNEGLIEEEFAYQASLMGGAASAAQAAVAHNAAISAPPVAAAPAVPASAAAGAAVPETKMPSFPNTPEGKQAMQDWIDSGDWRKAVFPSTQ